MGSNSFLVSLRLRRLSNRERSHITSHRRLLTQPTCFDQIFNVIHFNFTPLKLIVADKNDWNAIQKSVGQYVLKFIRLETQTRL